MRSIQASPSLARPSSLRSVRTLLTCLVPGLLGVGFLMYRAHEDGACVQVDTNLARRSPVPAWV